jgi:hypothetical protein
MGEGGTSAEGLQDGPRNGQDEPTRSDITTEAQAARHGWEIPQTDRNAILDRLVKLAKDGTARPRTALSAARAVNAFARLDLDERKAGLQEPETPPQPTNDIDARDILREMKETECARKDWIQSVKSRYCGSSSPSPTAGQRTASSPTSTAPPSTRETTSST